MSQLDAKTNTSPRDSLIAGATAGCLARFVVAPLDLVKIRLQLSTTPHVFGNTARMIKDVYLNEGIRAFWKGNSAAECLYMSYSAIQFVSLNYVNKELLKIPQTSQLSEPVRQLIAGAISGAFTTVCTYPFDLVRTRVAASKAHESALVPILKEIWQNRGIAGFYKGVVPYVFSIFPYMGSFFSIYSISREKLSDVSIWWLPNVLSASAFAAASSKTIIFPFDTVRKRTQAHGLQIYGSKSTAAQTHNYSHKFWPCAGQILRNEGLRGYYRGLGLAVTKSVPGSAMTMLFYEQTLKFLKAMNLSSSLSTT